MVPSGSVPTSPPIGTLGYRLRRDALRILAQKFEGRALSPMEAENLLANHQTLEGSLDALRRQKTNGRQSRRFGGEGQLGMEIGTLQPLWIVRVAALIELFLAGLFLHQIR
jgi:hypothetical protein